MIQRSEGHVGRKRDVATVDVDENLGHQPVPPDIFIVPLSYLVRTYPLGITWDDRVQSAKLTFASRSCKLVGAVTCGS